MFNKFKELFSRNQSSIVEPRDFVSGLRFPENINDDTYAIHKSWLVTANQNLLKKNLTVIPVVTIEARKNWFKEAYKEFPDDSWDMVDSDGGLVINKYGGSKPTANISLRFVYDKNGRLVMDYDAAGRTTTYYEYDGKGFLKRVSRDVRRASYGNTDKYFYTEGVLSSIESQMWSRDSVKSLPYKWGEAFTVSRD